MEKNVLSVAAERHWTPAEGDQVVIAERPQGRFERKLYLSDNLDTDRHRGPLRPGRAVAAHPGVRGVQAPQGAGDLRRSHRGDRLRRLAELSH